MGALPNDIRDALADVRISVHEIYALERACSVLGMNELGVKLWNIAIAIDKAQYKVLEVANQHFNKWCGDVEQQSANVIRAALAGGGVNPDGGTHEGS